ncbi:MAG: helix-turn-helix domain-containing protein [Deltaproteobacteria bacterium]|nr:helix-turn-helix domain-containing protein [Deltaproteobacteria bacterium]
MSAERPYVSAPLLTVSEAARYLGIGRKVLYRLLEDGRIRAVRAGGATLVEKGGLDEFKARGEMT